MKSILFVINTMGMGGGENALLELLRCIDLDAYDVSLFVLTGQGELISKLPDGVKLLNKEFFPISVLDKKGKRKLLQTVLKALIIRGTIFSRLRYIVINLKKMIKNRSIQKDKLLWKILSDGAQRLEQEFDLAIAYLEGGAAYYVASYVKAKKKAAFIHIDYEFAGYSRELDEECYLCYDRVFAVSENVKDAFLSVYPECKPYTEVFYNLIDKEKIICRSKENGGFADDFDGFRILTVGRLVPQKALGIAIDAMKILKSSGKRIRWYVLGEGELRKQLEEKIHACRLEKDFLLLGVVENPFPYYRQCDLYVQTSFFEGKSVAVEEAQTLGCAVLVTDYGGVREQIRDGVNGKICKPGAKELADAILYLIDHQKECMSYRYAAAGMERIDGRKEIGRLIAMLSGNDD